MVVKLEDLGKKGLTSVGLSSSNCGEMRRRVADRSSCDVRNIVAAAPVGIAADEDGLDIGRICEFIFL